MGGMISTRPASVVYTDARRVDVGELSGARLDMEVGDTEDFQLTCPAEYPIEGGSLVYVDGTSWGGIVDHRVPTTGSPTTSYRGRTWAGVMAERIVRPPTGADYYEYDCDANELLRRLVASLGLDWLFAVPDGAAGIRLSGRFDRYADMWAGIRKAARAAGARVSVLWGGTRAQLTMVPRSVVEADPSRAPATVDEPWRVVNHLVCLGQGELSERTVLDLYADADGNVSATQTLFGPDERAATYDYSNAEADELLAEGTRKLRELQERSSVSVDASALDEDVMLGDLVRAVDDATGAEATAEVTRLVVRVEDGQLRVSCEAGEGSISGGGDASALSAPDPEPGAAVAAAAGRAADAVDTAQQAQQTAEDIPIVGLLSSNGTVFKRNLGVSTTITATIFTPGGRIETAAELHRRFGAGAYLQWGWRDVATGTDHVLVASDPRIIMDGFGLVVSPEDIDTQAVITCSLNY